jgi:hypothetical protein
MLIDCDQCELRDIACPDCVVMALQPSSRQAMAGRRCEIGEAEGRALRVLADAKLVPPLRLRPRLQAPLPKAS